MDRKKIIKAQNMMDLYNYRQYLVRHPKLAYLFLELTDACNLNCIHCGSTCSAEKKQYIDKELLLKALETIAEDFVSKNIMVCVSGGEPLLHPDFFEIINKVVELGFPWGLTTNATRTDRQTVERLKKLKLNSVTVSLDGTRDIHNAFRGNYMAYDDTITSINEFNNIGINVQVTTVIHRENYDELENLYELMCSLNIKSWRVINIEPIGRAYERKDLLLSNEQMHGLLDFIRNKRFESENQLEIVFGCSHYLSYEYEHEVRDNYFLCGSGLYVASILCNGDIYSCLDIERRKELVQGNIATDRFSDVWFHGFEEFRKDRTVLNKICNSCEERLFCGGDSTHTWDYDKNMPRYCINNRF